MYLCQAELQARKKKADESMANLGSDVVKLVWLAYPTAVTATREVLGINAFLETLRGRDETLCDKREASNPSGSSGACHRGRCCGGS